MLVYSVLVFSLLVFSVLFMSVYRASRVRDVVCEFVNRYDPVLLTMQVLMLGTQRMETWCGFFLSHLRVMLVWLWFKYQV